MNFSVLFSVLVTNILILVSIYKFIMDLFFSSGSPAHHHQEVEVSIFKEITFSLSDNQDQEWGGGHHNN